MPSSLEDYEILYKIGSGSYGTCKKIRRKKDGKILVWKEIDYGEMTEAEKQMLVSEVNLLRELKHQHIVRYYDRIIDRSNTKIYIIMEYCEGGDMASMIKRCTKECQYMDEDFIWKIFAQVVQALHECHSRTRTKKGKAILHRDLKPANVFLDAKMNVKLGDFGLARVLNHETSFAKTFVGTPYYMSPEQMNYMSYNEKSDIWSLGCLLYEICSLRPPFTAGDQGALATRIRAGKFNRIPHRYSHNLSDLIGSMLQVEVHKRPCIDALIENQSLMKYMSKLECRPSTSEGSSTECDNSLKKREDELVARETAVSSKEKELESREKALYIRETLAEEKLARAERILKEVELNSKVNPLTGLNMNGEEPSPLRSCLIRKRKDSPKKQVTFTYSDNQTSITDTTDKHDLDHVRTNLNMKFDLYDDSICLIGDTYKDIKMDEQQQEIFTQDPTSVQKVTEVSVRDQIDHDITKNQSAYNHKLNSDLYTDHCSEYVSKFDAHNKHKDIKPEVNRYSDVLSTITNNYNSKKSDVFLGMYDPGLKYTGNDFECYYKHIGPSKYKSILEEYPDRITSKYSHYFTEKYEPNFDKYGNAHDHYYRLNDTKDAHKSKYSTEFDKKNDLQERWTRAKKRSEELRRAEEESRYKTRQLLAMR